MHKSRRYNFMLFRQLAQRVLLAAVALVSLADSSQAAEPKKIRLGYFEGGKYPYHDRLKDEFFRQLNTILPDSIEAAFAPEGYRSAEWDKAASTQMAKELTDVKTIDLVVAAGPWVVRDLLNAGFKKPIIGIHQFAPQYEGLLDKKGKPVASNLTIHYQKNKIESDLTALASLVKLKRLGLLYFPSSGEADSVLAQVKAVGVKLGFEVVTASGENNKGTFAFFNAYGKLEKNIDALYVGPMWACDIQMINQFFYNADHDKIPVMTSEDRFLVDRGAFLTNNAFGIFAEARFDAYKTAQIIMGNKPNKLPVEFSIPSTLAINEAAARKNRISIEPQLYSEAYLVPAPPDEDVTIVTLSYANGRAVSFNPGDTAQREAVESALKEAMKAYKEYFPNSVNRSNLHEDVFSLRTMNSIQIAQVLDGPEPNNPVPVQLKLEQAVTEAFLNYLKAEEVLKVEFRLRELIDRNIAVSHARHLAEKVDDRDLTGWRVEREKSTQSIVYAQNNLKVARILLNVLMNYPAEQELSLEVDRFNVESTQKLYGQLFEFLSEKSVTDSIAEKIVEITGKSPDETQPIFKRLLSAFENLAEVSRKFQLERITLEETVTRYDASEIDFSKMVAEIDTIRTVQLSEISSRYEFYESMSEISSLLGWSAYETGTSFVTRIEKLIIERQ